MIPRIVVETTRFESIQIVNEERGVPAYREQQDLSESFLARPTGEHPVVN
jgi:hypothetical protein